MEINYTSYKDQPSDTLGIGLTLNFSTKNNEDI